MFELKCTRGCNISSFFLAFSLSIRSSGPVPGGISPPASATFCRKERRSFFLLRSSTMSFASSTLTSNSVVTISCPRSSVRSSLPSPCFEWAIGGVSVKTSSSSPRSEPRAPAVYRSQCPSLRSRQQPRRGKTSKRSRDPDVRRPNRLD
jgi:hypothetical protein